MNKFLIFCVIITIQACTDDVTEYANNPEVWVDKGIQCSDEIVSATSSLSNLSPSIVNEIASYIDRTYGAPEYSISVKVSEIMYVGEYRACNNIITLWSYPCGKSQCFIGVQPWLDSYLTSVVNPEFNLNSGI